MGAPKQTLRRSQSNGNLWSTVQANINNDKKPYSARGQYYVNVNVLASRGAISLDETRWRQMIIDSIDESENVYEPVLKKSLSGPKIKRNAHHEYVSQQRSRIGGVKMGKAATNMDFGLIQDSPNVSYTGARRYADIVGHSNSNNQTPIGNTPSSGHHMIPENGQRKGASKLLRSLKRFKQRLMTATRGNESGLCDQSESKRDNKSGRSVPVPVLVPNTQQATVVKVTNQSGTYIYASSKARPEMESSLEFRKGSKFVSKYSEGPNSKSSDLHYAIQCYPDIIQSHNSINHVPSRYASVEHATEQKHTFKRAEGHEPTRKHTDETTARVNRPRKSNLKRQMVIRLPSSSKSVQANLDTNETFKAVRDGDIYEGQTFQRCGGNEDNSSTTFNANDVWKFGTRYTVGIQETNNGTQDKTSTKHSFQTDRQATNRKSFNFVEKYSPEHRQSCSTQAIVPNRFVERTYCSPIQWPKSTQGDGYLTDNPYDYEQVYTTGGSDKWQTNRGFDPACKNTPVHNERKIYHRRSYSAGHFPVSHSRTEDIKNSQECPSVRPSAPQMNKHGLELQIFRRPDHGDHSEMKEDSNDTSGGFTDRTTRSQSQKIIRRHKEYRKFNHSNQYSDDDRFCVAEVLV